MTYLLDAAIDYAERGWPVFPCQPRGKQPLIPKAAGGRGLHDATTDKPTIEKWWHRHPDANIGLRTGIAFDVLDVDGQTGQEALIAAIPDRAPMGLGYGPWAITGGGGDHVLYLPTGAGNRAGILPCVDWRGDGGYIIAPPSTHPSGHGYGWEFGPDYPLESAPAWLVELVLPAHPQPLRAENVAGVTRETPADAYARRALDGEVAGVATAPEGQRNHRLNVAAFNLGQLVGAGTINARTVAETLLTVATRIGLTEAEAVATIRSGLTNGMANPRKASA